MGEAFFFVIMMGVFVLGAIVEKIFDVISDRSKDENTR